MVEFKKRADQKMQDNGVWTGSVVFECTWAHPVWKAYLILAYDLTTTSNGVKLLSPDATHEFILLALDPEATIDYEKNVYLDPKPSILMPPNHGYQFKMRSNEDAWKLVNDAVDNIHKHILNPDTDHIRLWDLYMSAICPAWNLRDFNKRQLQ